MENKITGVLEPGELPKAYGRENRRILSDPISSATLRNPGSPQNPPPTRAERRPPAAPASPVLQKGQRWDIHNAAGLTPKTLKICIGWDKAQTPFELDASAFLLNQNGKVSNDSQFVFYGNQTSPDGSVVYRFGDEIASGRDNAEILVLLDRVSPETERIAVCLTIYEAIANHLHFGMVKNLYARLTDESGRELRAVSVERLSSEVTSLVLGEIYRYRGAWKFCATVSGYHRDLAEFCGIYGVNLE